VKTKSEAPTNSWAVITGANGGIGQALAHQCAKHGYSVVLAGREDKALRAVARQLNSQYSVKTLVVTGDLSSAATARKLYATVKQRKCQVEILINNAGFGDYGRFESTNPEVTESMIEVNIAALTTLTRLFGPDMLKQKHGRIMNVASTAAFLPGPYMAVYYATKAYVLSFSQALSQEWKGTGVTVTALCPGPTKTGFATASHATQSSLFRGKLPTPDAVADYGFKAMQRGKPVAIHGFGNKVVIQLSRVMSRRLQRRLVARAQKP
jgi:short-subunit dehydrogenase